MSLDDMSELVDSWDLVGKLHTELNKATIESKQSNRPARRVSATDSQRIHEMIVTAYRAFAGGG